MLKPKDIKSIETGSRQLTFDFEEKIRAETDDLVMSCFREQISTHGRIFLAPLIFHVKETHDLAEPDSLQSVFRSAGELKIHFRSDGIPVTPYQAKKLLLDFPDKPLELVGNQQVETPIFRDLVLFYQQLMNKDNANFQNDQYEFALSLLSDLKVWESNLASFETMARKPFYPGKQKINDLLQFLKQILIRQDSYSLICMCYDKREGIAEMAGDINILSRFFTQHKGFWDLLIKSMDEFCETLSELRQNPEASDGFDRLSLILSSPSPWDLIPEAEQLLKTVQNHNDRILEEKIKTRRREAISFIDALIKKLSDLPANRNSDQEHRSNCLYQLRNAKKQMEMKNSIKEIDRLAGSMEDMAEDALNFQ